MEGDGRREEKEGDKRWKEIRDGRREEVEGERRWKELGDGRG
jgi:hypothetical protein